MCDGHGSIKGNWGVTIKGTEYVYEGLRWDFAPYVGGGRSYSDLTKADYLREKAKVI